MGQVAKSEHQQTSTTSHSNGVIKSDAINVDEARRFIKINDGRDSDPKKDMMPRSYITKDHNGIMVTGHASTVICEVAWEITGLQRELAAKDPRTNTPKIASEAERKAISQDALSLQKYLTKIVSIHPEAAREAIKQFGEWRKVNSKDADYLSREAETVKLIQTRIPKNK